MIPKPKHRRHRPQNNAKPTINDTCEYTDCGRPYAHSHEGPLGPHLNREYDLQLKREAQAKFERVHGRAEFVRLFGKNYSE